MRIQHNIMAMNAYRNYNLNNKALAGNLEKLSSGYKINRAGDDAAGLAISEKMRAQISGLEAAQKNVKDGTSLVKTAEGAMQEVQDMLNRMVTLATQSANGTYDNEIDRAALQQEIDQLNSEINRIADSANFNGIKLLDGSLDANGRVASTTTVFSGLAMGNNKFGIGAGKNAVTSDGSVFGSGNTKNGLVLTGGYLQTGESPTATTANSELYKSDNSVRYHKDAAPAGKTSFTVDLDGINYNVSAGTKVEGLEFCLQAGNAPDGHGTGVNNLFLDNQTTADAAKGATGTAAVLTYDVVAGSEGITSADIAKAIYDKIQDNGGKVYIDPVKGGQTAAADRIEYTVTLDGDKLHFEMTDDGYNKAVDKAATAATDDNFFQGNFNFGVAMGAAETVTGTDAEKAAIEARNAFKAAIPDKLKGNVATCEINEGKAPSGTIYAQAFIRFDVNNAQGTSENLAHEVIKDGAGIQIGDEYYLFAGSDKVFNTEYQDNVKVVDIRDLSNLNSTKYAGDAAAKQQYADDLRTALTRLSVAAKDNEMFDVQVEERGSMLVLNERTTYTGDANLTEDKWGLESQIQKFDSATSKTTVEKEAGKALTLQIGDTSEEFNQLKVNIGDIHAKALGVDKVDVSTQEGAAAAINTIKAAINKVSSIRGTLGATQNRLDHTANNLSVMAENIQDAESTIRDTDVAEEMMKYVKNNILVQSAQAMLAQANQLPQGVLQLLG